MHTANSQTTWIKQAGQRGGSYDSEEGEWEIECEAEMKDMTEGLQEACCLPEFLKRILAVCVGGWIWARPPEWEMTVEDVTS